MSNPYVHPRFLLAVRLVLGLIWLHEGLWRKILDVSLLELKVVQSLPYFGGESARATINFIGGCETLLAVGVFSGILYRFVSWFQVGLLITMNSMGILFGGGAIEDPVDLLLKNTPIVLCAMMIALYGPGSLKKPT